MIIKKSDIGKEIKIASLEQFLKMGWTEQSIIDRVINKPSPITGYEPPFINGSPLYGSSSKIDELTLPHITVPMFYVNHLQYHMVKDDPVKSGLYGIIAPYKLLHDLLDNGVETFTLFPLIAPRKLIAELKLTDISLVSSLLTPSLKFFIDDGEHTNEEMYQEELERRVRAL